ncbi:hypothetical protein BJ741DRAFT_410645 [Chytriomyces cf. hyalinus JEL632]|nr:hypothetical protein BJ741DRAFT_410645 [Chytriomyces cf. hyalinus JEL632]
MKSAILAFVALAATAVSAEDRIRAAPAAANYEQKYQHKQEYGITTNTPFRCGKSWFDANDKCGAACPSGKDYECSYGEKCFRDLQKTCGADSYKQPNQYYEKPKEYYEKPKQYYEKPKEYYQAPKEQYYEAPKQQYYEAPKQEYYQAPSKYSNSPPKYEQKYEHKQEYGITTNTPFRCGKSWFDANDKCGAACPSGKDYECGYGEKCFRDLQKTCDSYKQPNQYYEKPKEYYEAPKYEAPKYESPKYEAPKYEAPKYEAPKQEYKPEYSGGGSNGFVSIGGKCTLVSNNNLNFGCTSDNKIAVCGPAGPDSKWQFSDNCGKYKAQCSVSASYAGCA